MSSKEAAKAFKEHRSYAGYFDYVDNVAIKTCIIEKSGAALIVDVTVYNYGYHGEGAGQKALQSLNFQMSSLKIFAAIYIRSFWIVEDFTWSPKIIMTLY